MVKQSSEPGEFAIPALAYWFVRGEAVALGLTSRNATSQTERHRELLLRRSRLAGVAALLAPATVFVTRTVLGAAARSRYLRYLVLFLGHLYHLFPWETGCYGDRLHACR